MLCPPYLVIQNYNLNNFLPFPGVCLLPAKRKKRELVGEYPEHPGFLSIVKRQIAETSQQLALRSFGARLR